MTLFEFDSYKYYINSRIQAFPKKGYGQKKRLARYLGVSTTFISQILKGDKSFNLEQGSQVCEYFGLSEIETEYFLKLILIERAGTEKLKSILLKDLRRIQIRAQSVASRLKVDKVLGGQEKAVFYSDWSYSAIRLLTGIDGFQDIDSISKYFGLSRILVGDIINFLLQTQLLISDQGKLKVGPNRTHLSADSPFIKLHHQNWRYKALEYVKSPHPGKLHYCAPMTLGKKEAVQVKKLLLTVIEEVGKVVDTAPNEELMCLNVDWFRIGSADHK